ncbi:MAG: ABC transporter permease [Candidatus Woesearchaeota archaeon]
MKAMYVLWLRQVKRYFRSKPRIVGAMMQPLLFLLALGFGFGPIYAKAGGGNYIQFIAPGIIAMSILFTSIFSGVDIIWDRQFGFLKETLVAPVSRLELMLGRTLGGATVAVIQGSIVFIISLIVGFRLSSWSMLPVALLFMFLIAVAFTGLGTAIGSLMEDMQGFQLIMNFLIMPIFFLSGALFPLTELPRGIFLVTRFDPLSYGVDGLRFALTGTAAFSLLYDFLVMVGVGVLFVGMGSYFFSKVQL